MTDDNFLILEQANFQIFDNLNERQREAVCSSANETLVIAGAGSGKTAVLTRRCAYLITQGALPGSILALTFTNKAAAEMNNRMRNLLFKSGINLPVVQPWQVDYNQAPLFCTFHSLGVRILKEFGELVGVHKNFSILDPDDQSKIIREILKEMNIDSKQLTPNYASYFISQCKQELLTPDESSKLEKEFLPVFHQVYLKYWNKCIEQNVVDFDDLILKNYLVLSQNDDVRILCQKRWKHILVDEFQDTNVAQFEIINLLHY
jgi:DNA helicase II / ATP-dependent DNA helicase PcrA